MGQYDKITVERINGEAITFGDIIQAYEINAAVLAEDADVSYFSILDFKAGKHDRQMRDSTARLIAEALTDTTGAPYDKDMVRALVANSRAAFVAAENAGG